MLKNVDVDIPSYSEKLVITLLVMRAFSDLLGASMDCSDFRDPTAVFRFNDLDKLVGWAKEERRAQHHFLLQE